MTTFTPVRFPARNLRLVSSPAVPPRLPPAGRALLLVGGTLLSTICFALTIRADLGLGPLYAVQDGFARLVGMTLGQSVIVVGVALVLLAALLGKRPGPGTIIVPVVTGIALGPTVEWMPTIEGLGMRIAVVVVASWLLGLGGVIVVRAALGMAALDAVMLGLQRYVPHPVGRVRLAMEAAMLLVGWWLGGAIGVGTVITGLVIGPAMQFWFELTGPSPDQALDPAPA